MDRASLGRTQMRGLADGSTNERVGFIGRDEGPDVLCTIGIVPRDTETLDEGDAVELNCARG